MDEHKAAYRELIGIPTPGPEVESHHRGKARVNDTLASQHRAANIIQRAWIGYSMKMTFRRLRDQLAKAERSLTLEILRRLSPKEAELVSDPVFKPRIRFRFGGSAFPPSILYKIFTKSSSVHYYSGHRLIHSGTQAAVDSCQLMGVRLYSENMLQTEKQNRALKIAHLDDVTNRMEFVQYISALDQKPAHLGGRNNGWRELTITPLASGQNWMYDMRVWRQAAPQRFSTSLSRSSRLRGSVTTKGTYRVGQSRRRSSQAPSLGSRSISHTIEDVDDDFDPLYEWTTQLSADSLHDYIVDYTSGE
ncbi:hypothetical protein BC832DRAFT_28569 [Gaertneriomyces semiglobifer]|nr:hypothetical protein BC832DRAFT_28569 [Gaertneriomyces semiglobifer]